jgi:hypothetical protein
VSKRYIAPAIPAEEIMKLRAHIDECITDPDYSVVVNYKCQWEEVELGFGSNFGFLDNFSAFKP